MAARKKRTPTPSSSSVSPGFDPALDVMIDARNLRGLTHPLRLRMLGLLRERGPATATMLATALGESSGATSYHIRQLADYGFVVEDAERAHGRERWWRSAHRSSYFNTAAGTSDDERLLGEAYMRGVVRAMTARMEAWVDASPTLPDEWRGAGTISDYRMLLTREQVSALVERLDQIGVEGRIDDDAASDPRARRVAFQFQVLPDPGHILDAEDGAPETEARDG